MSKMKKFKVGILGLGYIGASHIDAIRRIHSCELVAVADTNIDYAKENNVNVSIRGLRAITDFEYELQIAQTNRKLSEGALDTFFLTTSLEYSYLSSSSVREIAYFGGDISQCVPDYVREQVMEKYRLLREK